MPLCRRPLAASPHSRSDHAIVRVSRYVVHRRTAPRAANDNRRPRGAIAWPWAVAFAAAPTLTAALIIAHLI